MLIRQISKDSLSSLVFLCINFACLCLLLVFEDFVGIGPGQAHVDEQTYLKSSENFNLIFGSGYFFLSWAFGGNLFYLVGINVLVYLYTNVKLYGLLRRHFCRSYFQVFIALVVILDLYRMHLALHVLKDTLVIFLIVIVFTSNRVVSILSFLGVCFLRLASPLYIIGLIRSPVVLLVAIIFLFASIEIFVPGTLSYLLRGGNETMVFQSYDAVPTFNELGILGDVLRAFVWPFLTISGGYIMLSPTVMFVPMAVSAAALQVVFFLRYRRFCFSLGIYVSMSIYALFTPGFTTFIRYVYPLLTIMPLLALGSYHFETSYDYYFKRVKRSTRAIVQAFLRGGAY
ncbi:hypothetical protein GH975_08635 [Litorivicinus lipolyticus]|uniref:EpsG family protein n=1 Tax=Litorivicinus lipolyticus TaxID=418701 RepID=A0A5Q2QE77_9GAMM|nr:hypothetical protein [Litorivicinus lipolyticus]QGG80632.1 hypothetical protein GH975_08635 [Litorivicinus lipolyticus]